MTGKPQPSWANTPSGTMTASVLDIPRKTLSLSTKYPRPTLPSQDWILVNIKAAGLNRAELRSRTSDIPGKGEFNIFQAEYHEEPPVILGEEFVGLVHEAGSNTRFKVGEKVAGWIFGGGKAHDGAYAQFVICHKRRLYHLPQDTTLDWETLGAIPMSMWTAYGSIFEAGQLQSGQTLLVHGGTSSVGIWACLLAQERGCTVIATTRNRDKVEKLKAAGPDHVVLEEDLQHGAIMKIVPKGVDVILELVGPDALESFTLQNLARHGTAVCTGMLTKGWDIKGFRPSMIPPTRKLTFYGMTNRGSLGDEDECLEIVEDVLCDVVRNVEKGRFKREMFLDRVFDLSEAQKAHDYMEENRAVGKVVLRIPNGE